MPVGRHYVIGTCRLVCVPLLAALATTAIAGPLSRLAKETAMENSKDFPVPLGSPFDIDALCDIYIFYAEWQYSAVSGNGSEENFQLSAESHDADRQHTKIASAERTARLSNAPRCSKSSMDIQIRRRKRFVTHVSKWQHRDIQWRFRDPFDVFLNRTDFNIAKETVTHAFSMWSLASKHALRFRDVSDLFNDTQNVDIDVFFATNDHGDHEPFDGRGGIVAHSGYPQVGKIHFDASELWMINGDDGIDLRYVVLHETGHALGLRHSKHKEAIMHPIYRNTHRPREIALSDDDIKGIRYLYPAEGGYRSAVGQTSRNRDAVRKKLASVDFEDY